MSDYKIINHGGNSLKIKKFNLNLIKQVAPYPTLGMIAKRGSGKSYAIKAIMNNFRTIPGGNVISMTEEVAPFFTEFFPDLFVYGEYSPSIVEQLINRVILIKEKNKRRMKERKRPVDERSWLIMDDCLAANGSVFRKDPFLRRIFMEGRHFKFFYIITMQYPLGIPPDLRTNFDFIFIFGENFYNVRKKIYDNYAGLFPSFELFLSVFKKCTVNYGCMVIDNKTKSDRIEDMVYWWRAPATQIKKFIGHKSFIQHHLTYYDPEHFVNRRENNIIDKLYKKKKNACELNIALVS